jgi:hypothetical protein
MARLLVRQLTPWASSSRLVGNAVHPAISVASPPKRKAQRVVVSARGPSTLNPKRAGSPTHPTADKG